MCWLISWRSFRTLNCRLGSQRWDIWFLSRLMNSRIWLNDRPFHLPKLGAHVDEVTMPKPWQPLYALQDWKLAYLNVETKYTICCHSLPTPTVVDQKTTSTHILLVYVQPFYLCIHGFLNHELKCFCLLSHWPIYSDCSRREILLWLCVLHKYARVFVWHNPRSVPIQNGSLRPKCSQ